MKIIDSTDVTPAELEVFRCYFEQCLADTEGDVDDDEVRMVREALASKAVIPLLDPTAYLGKT